MIKVLIIFYILFSVSCSITKIENSKPDSSFMGVSVENSDLISVPEINQNENINDSNVGPRQIKDQQKGEELNNQVIKKKIPVIALVLGPGLYRSAGHISLIKNLSSKKIKTNIILGSGFSAIVGAMYAFGMTPSRIEWQFYKFIRAVKNKKPYTKPWQKVVEKTLLKLFEGKNIEEAKLILVIPVYDRNKKNVVFLSRGSLYQALQANLITSSSSRFKYSSPLKKNFYKKEIIKKMGADIVIGSDVLNKNLVMKHGDDFLTGLYGKLITFYEAEEKNIDLFFRLPTDIMPLDSYDELSSLMQRCYNASEQHADSILEYIKTWQEKLSDSEGNE